MAKKPEIDFDLPELDLGNEKVKNLMGHKPENNTRVIRKVVPITLEGEEVELFNESFNSSTSKTQSEFAKKILLNYFSINP